MTGSDNEIQVFGVGALSLIPFIVGLILWVLLALVAAAVAPDGRRAVFFFLTLLLLGPLGVHAALIASPRPGGRSS